MILRHYGRGRVLPRESAEYAALLSQDFAGREPPGARQMIALGIESVQTSCGYSVPSMAFQSDRPILLDWAECKGEAGLRAYWGEKSLRSIDGIQTGMAEDLATAAE